MKKFRFHFLVCLLLLIFAAVQAPAQQGKSLKWSLGLQNIKTGEMVSCALPVQSKTGDHYRLMVQASSKCFLYVIYESADGEDVLVLYSGPFKESWQSDVLVLTEPGGTESFFVIASYNEQKDLAQRVEALRSNYGITQKRALMAEVHGVRRNISQFKESPEKPVLMGGASRGSQDKNEGVEFSGLSTYVKTISIEH